MYCFKKHSRESCGSTDVRRNVCKVNLHSSLTKVDSVCPLLYKWTHMLHSAHLSTWQVFKYEFNSNELTWKHCWKCYYKHHFLKSESVFAHGSTCACEQSRWFRVRLSVWTVSTTLSVLCPSQKNVTQSLWCRTIYCQQKQGNFKCLLTVYVWSYDMGTVTIVVI